MLYKSEEHLYLYRFWALSSVGFQSTVQMKWFLIESLDLIHVGERYITHLIAAVGSQSDALDAFPHVKL